MSSTVHTVFVYGTLKKNEPNEHWLTNPENGYARFLGEATSSEKYPLVIASKYNIPHLIDSPGRGHYIRGEVYEVDDKMLGNLDILEDHPIWYVREKREVNLNNNSKLKPWVYLLKTFKPSLLQLPFSEEYKSKGPHGKIYCERQLRDSSYNARIDVQGL